MQFTPIDLKTWPRREIFYYFSKMAPTGYSLTIELDITALKKQLKAHKMKFYPAYLWLVTKALNEQTAFKMAEKEGVLGYYDTLTPLYAVFHEDDHTFSLMWTPYEEDFLSFYKACEDNLKKHGQAHGILAQKGQVPPPNSYTVSCMPWVDFKHFAVHSYENKPYYFPSIESGRHYERDGKWFMPLAITCHHAATDGYHIHLFIEALKREIETFTL